MSDQPSTFARIEKLIRDVVVFDGEISAETTFEDDLNFDSLDAVELIIDVEDEFAIELADDEGSHLRTVGAFVQLIEQKVAAA